jgi:hypothetical protein
MNKYKYFTDEEIEKINAKMKEYDLKKLHQEDDLKKQKNAMLSE